MRPAIGFVIVTHRDPPQLVRLAARLQDVFGASAPIVAHHDFGQCALDPASLPTGVRLVRPHFSTGWGTWNWVEAVLAGLRLLHGAGSSPDYTVLLSGADYPVQPASRVLGDLRASGADAFLQASRVSPWRRDRSRTPGPLGFGVNEGPGNTKVCYRRYYPTTFRPLGIRIRVRNPLLAPLLTPFSRRFGCFAGEPWWTLGRRAVEALLESRESRPELARWFQERTIPEEAYVHTVVCNAPGLRVAPDHFRYVDWSSCRPNPRQLGVPDLPRIAERGAHFARKFAPDDDALDAIDAALGLAPWAADPRRGAGIRVR